MVGSAEPVNGFLCLKTTKMYVLLHETVGSTEPTDGFLDPAMQETSVLLHETEGSEDSTCTQTTDCKQIAFVPHLLLLGTAFWGAFNYVHHCTPTPYTHIPLYLKKPRQNAHSQKLDKNARQHAPNGKKQI